MNKTVEILQSARKTLSVPDHWIQRAYARDVYNDIVSVCAAGAYCLCLVGAIERASIDITDGDNTVGEMRAAEAVVASCIGGKFSGVSAPAIIRWNDTPGRTHAEVLAVLDAAIERAKAQQ